MKFLRFFVLFQNINIVFTNTRFQDFEEIASPSEFMTSWDRLRGSFFHALSSSLIERGWFSET